MYDTGEAETPDGPLPYIVMEYVDGVTLRDIVHDDGPIEPRRAIEIIADACQALNFSHQHGIIHRDVKPANIMINNAGAVKVMDFGIARALPTAAKSVTQTAAVIGTAQYLSPEQARGETVDARSDVYSLGCVLYELLTGEPPFVGDSPVAVAYQHVREDPLPPSRAQPGLSPELDAVVLKALAKNPANRYQTAAEMRTDLIRVRDGRAARRAEGATPTRTTPTSPRPRPATAGSPAAAAGRAGGGWPWARCWPCSRWWSPWPSTCSSETANASPTSTVRGRPTPRCRCRTSASRPSSTPSRVRPSNGGSSSAPTPEPTRPPGSTTPSPSTSPAGRSNARFPTSRV